MHVKVFTASVGLQVARIVYREREREREGGRERGSIFNKRTQLHCDMDEHTPPCNPVT